MKKLTLSLFLAAPVCSGCAGLFGPTPEEKWSQALLQQQLAETDRQLAESDKRIEEIKARPQKRQQKREEFVKAHPKLSAATRKSILEGVVTIGMTSEQVRASYGEDPDKINRSVYSWGVQEQWIYGDQFLYFKDGKLDSWQD